MPDDTKVVKTLRRGLVAAAMALAVALVGGLAFWDESREQQAALDDFAEEQATVASSVAVDLAARLAGLRRAGQLLAQLADEPGRQTPTSFGDLYAVRLRGAHDPPQGAPPEGDGLVLAVPMPDGRVVEFIAPARSLLLGLDRIERTRSLLVLVKPPRLRQLHRPDGSALVEPALLAALDSDKRSLRLLPESAQLIGLPARTALAGLAWAEGGALGRWGVAVVATAEKERDRELRARWRLLLAVLVAGSLVLFFGGLLLREQGRELLLARRLAEREHDERLEREAKAATMVTLASGVAHEISTPLGVIVGRAEQLALRHRDDERSAKSAGIILEQAESIRQVIRGFLGLARGKSPQLGDAQPSQIVDNARELVLHRFGKAGVKLEVTVQEGLPAVRCDRRLLEHAVVNLLLNACDACPPGGEVRLSARSGDGLLALLVEDDGAGIEPAVARRATEPFFSTKPADQGTGIGLAIASEIAKSHRGTLTIGPRPSGKGTIAQLHIPIAAEATA